MCDTYAQRVPVKRDIYQKMRNDSQPGQVQILVLCHKTVIVSFDTCSLKTVTTVIAQ